MSVNAARWRSSTPREPNSWLFNLGRVEKESLQSVGRNRKVESLSLGKVGEVNIVSEGTFDSDDGSRE